MRMGLSVTKKAAGGSFFGGSWFSGDPGELSNFSSRDRSVALHSIWSGRADLNGRPLAPQASTLPGCATPRHALFDFTMSRIVSLEAGGMQPIRRDTAGWSSVRMRLQNFEDRLEVSSQFLREFF